MRHACDTVPRSDRIEAECFNIAAIATSRLLRHQRIIAPHHALQFGEFTDDAGGKIGLAQARGTFCLVDIGADDFRDFVRPAFRCARRAPIGAELGVENDVLQIVDAGFERALTVLIPEELRIRQPRA
jgi:hypothetical protein